MHRIGIVLFEDEAMSNDAEANALIRDLRELRPDVSHIEVWREDGMIGVSMVEDGLRQGAYFSRGRIVGNWM